MEAKQLSKQAYIQLVHNFEESPNQWEFLGKRPALIDIYASWCGPCQHLSPILDELAEEYAGKAKVFKADIDECQGLAAKFRIMNVPTVLYFKGGQVVDKNVGGAAKQVFEDKLKKLI